MLPQIDLLLHGFGANYANGTATAYLAGTTTLATWYSDAAATTPAANPVTLSVSGTATVYSNDRLRIDVKNSAGVSAPGFPIDNLGFGNYLAGGNTLSSYASLAAAVAAIGATKTTLVVDENATVSADLTIPATIDLQVINEAQITIASGKTLTINGPFSAPETQCFAGAGSVVLNATRDIEAVWFGVTGDGTDESVEMQKAMDSFPHGGTLHLGQGTFKFNITLNNECYVRGMGAGQTVVNPATDAPVFSNKLANHLIRSGVSELFIDGRATKATFTNAHGIEIICRTGYFVDTLKFDNLIINGMGGYGFHTRGTGIAFNQVQAMWLTRVKIDGCVKEGIFLDGLHLECVFQEVWSSNCGDMIDTPNVTLGMKPGDVSSASVSRLTWTTGGIIQTFKQFNTRFIADAVFNAASKTLTSATAAFDADDVGMPIVLDTNELDSSPLQITTIASVTSATEVELTDAARISGSARKAIVNTPTSGGVRIYNCTEVNFIGIEFEECGAFIKISGAEAGSINVYGSSFISSNPAIAAVWISGNFHGKLNMYAWRLFTSDYVLYGVVSASETGLNTPLFYEGNIEKPQYNGQIVNSLVFVYSQGNMVSGVLRLPRSDMNLYFVDGRFSGPLTRIEDNNSNTSGYPQGYQITLFSNTSEFNIKHSSNNLQLRGGVDTTLLANTNITFAWDSYYKMFYEVHRSENYSNAAPTTGTWSVGSRIYQRTPVVGQPKSWVCTVAGTLGTLTGVTGSIGTGTAALTVNSVTDLRTGQYITIAGVSGIKKILTITGLVCTLDSNADATVTGAAVAFSAATFVSEGNL